MKENIKSKSSWFGVWQELPHLGWNGRWCSRGGSRTMAATITGRVEFSFVEWIISGFVSVMRMRSKSVITNLRKLIIPYKTIAISSRILSTTVKVFNFMHTWIGKIQMMVGRYLPQANYDKIEHETLSISNNIHRKNNNIHIQGPFLH